MRKLFICAIALMAFASCSKEENNNQNRTEKGLSAVNISFVNEKSNTRAFFGSESAEMWEKALNTVTIFAFNPSGELLVQRQFTSSEISSKKASFILPNATSGDKCEFYAVANSSVSIKSKAQLLALLENSATAYNGTFAEVTTKTKRADGFVMSGNIVQTIATSGTATNIAITLKRTVAKLAIEAVQSADFSNRYGGAVRVNSANLTKGASQTLVLKSTIPSTGSMNFSHTQTSNITSDKSQNLFYLFENGNLPLGNRVVVELQATYDIDGNFTTTSDQWPVTYTVELDGTTGGAIQRNGYYKLQIAINGLTGDEASVNITVADWEVPTTQTVNVGQ